MISGFVPTVQSAESGSDAQRPQIHVVLNWVDELKRLVPVK